MFAIFTLLLLATFSSSLLAANASDTSHTLNDWFGVFNGFLENVFFFDVLPGEANMPFVVAWLVVGAVFLTIRMGFINLRMFKHAYLILRGKYQVPGSEGEVLPSRP